jgi:hypothetical protein
MTGAFYAGAAMPDEPSERTIRIDGVPYQVTALTMSGAQIKALAQKDAVYQLFLEEAGKQADRLVQDHEALYVGDGQAFYTVPPAMAG